MQPTVPVAAPVLALALTPIPAAKPVAAPASVSVKDGASAECEEDRAAKEVVTGVLWNRGESAGWKQRFVVLAAGKLSYYTTEAAYDAGMSPLKNIDLRAYAVIAGTPESYRASLSGGAASSPAANPNPNQASSFYLEPLTGCSSSRSSRSSSTSEPAAAATDSAAAEGASGSSAEAPDGGASMRRWEFRSVEAADREDWLAVFAEFGCTDEAAFTVGRAKNEASASTAAAKLAAAAGGGGGGGGGGGRLSPGWESAVTPEGDGCYYNLATGESQRYQPAGIVSVATAAATAPAPAPVGAPTCNAAGGGGFAARYQAGIAACGRHATPQALAFATDCADLVDAAGSSPQGSGPSLALAAIGWTAGALERAAPALLFVAPVALAAGALLRQCEAMRTNKSLAGELRETVAALQAVLREVSRNDAVAGKHEPTLRGMARRLDDATALLGRLGARSWVGSFFHAGFDGAQLAAASAQLRDWLGVLTAAVTAGAEGRLAAAIEEARTGVRADVAAALAAERTALAEAVRNGGAPLELAPMPSPTEDELAAWRDQVAGALGAAGLAAIDAGQLARAEAACGVARHAELLSALRSEFAGHASKLEVAIAAAGADAATRDTATRAAVDAVAAQLSGVSGDVAKLTAMFMAMRAEVADAYAAARTAGGSPTAAADAGRRAAARAASRLLLARVPTLPPGRLVVWDDVKLGEGSFGMVHAGLLLPAPDAPAVAWSRPTLVAVKRLLAMGHGGGGAAPPDPASVARFADEVRLQAGLTARHGAVVGVYGLVERRVASYGSGRGVDVGGTETLLVAELMACSLDDALYGPGSADVPLELPDRLAVLREIASVLAVLHGGVDGMCVTHGDVKSVSG